MSAISGRHTGYGGTVLDARTTGPLPRLRVFVIPGAERTIALRDGCIGFLLVHFALWWHETLHPLNAHGQVWDEWGYALRMTRGSTTALSEHSGGRAADLDATLHPRGVPILRTFTVAQIARIRARLRLYRIGGVQVLGWGGNYRRTVDGMHVEIAQGATLEQCNALALRLMNTPRGRRILAANPGLRGVIES